VNVPVEVGLFAVAFAARLRGALAQPVEGRALVEEQAVIDGEALAPSELLRQEIKLVGGW
jgi:hypothetical protein